MFVQLLQQELHTSLLAKNPIACNLVLATLNGYKDPNHNLSNGIVSKITNQAIRQHLQGGTKSPNTNPNGNVLCRQ